MKIPLTYITFLARRRDHKSLIMIENKFSSSINPDADCVNIKLLFL